MQTIDSSDEYERIVQRLGQLYDRHVYQSAVSEVSESVVGSYIDLGAYERTYTLETQARVRGHEVPELNQVLNPYSVIEYSRHYPSQTEFDQRDSTSALAQRMLSLDLNRVCRHVEAMR
jgi:hypothetical protein